VSYFFCDDKDDQLRTPQAILRDLLVQILRERPHALIHFVEETDYVLHGKKTLWNTEMLWRVFERCLKDDKIGAMYFIIDALGITFPLLLDRRIYPGEEWLTDSRRMRRGFTAGFPETIAKYPRAYS
jgi:hypothetical protein